MGSQGSFRRKLGLAKSLQASGEGLWDDKVLRGSGLVVFGIFSPVCLDEPGNP